MIVIYGATGAVGQEVAADLIRRGAQVALAGRDRRRLEAVAAGLGGSPPIRVASAHDPGSLEEAVAGARVVVGCAGPFRRIGEPVLRAALAAGAHYVDIAGDAGYLRASFESCEAAARRSGVVCVSGVGFEVAVGDWAAALACQRLREALGDRDGEPLDEVVIAHAVENPRRSPLEDLASPCPVWRVDRWETRAPASERRRFAFGPGFGVREAILFPRGEAITVPRHVAARSVRTFVCVDRTDSALSRVAPLLAPLAPLALGPLRGFLRSAAASRPRPAAPAGGEFAVVAEASHRFQRARVLVRGRDPIALAAHLCASAALSLTSQSSPSTGLKTGLLAPSQAFDPRTQLHLLESLGLIEVQ
jgi:hypothetical protein